MTPTIAVLGLGAMGLPMARHLAQSFPIRSYDIDAARRNAAADFSTACGSAKDAATGADIVLLAVRNRDQLVEVLWGSDGVVPGAVILPQGVALSGRFPYLKAGDFMELEIDGLGRQRQELTTAQA